jgi:hypothetical protein
LLSAPRTEPYVRLSRIRLPPWVRDGEAYSWPWMKGIRFREPIFGQLRNLLPSRAVFLTAPPERSLPKFGDEEAECGQRLIVGRHGIIVEVALDDLSQPFPLNRDRLMPAPPRLLLDGWQLRPHAVAPGFPFEKELAPTRLATDKSEAQEVEGNDVESTYDFALRARKRYG